MMMLRSALSALLLCSILSASSAFIAQPKAAHLVPSHSSITTSPDATFALHSTATDDATTEAADPLGLTPELRKITNAFSSIPDEKMRYKQLLFMAGQLPAVDDAIKVPENKVPGCLSTVYVDCSLSPEDDGTVKFVGDSDGLLTKGLVALLIRGMSGCTPEQIEAVDPEFIHAAKISQSLTPGRNNGFLNMIAVMKKKARDIAGGGSASGEEAEAAEQKDAPTEASASSATGEEIITSFEQRDGKPMYNEIMSKLIAVLKPTRIELVDNSDQHAGHAGSKGWEESGESHFALEIVSEAFDGLASVKRHQLIYMLLGETMEKFHALQIKAKTPEEV